ncbi:MAG: DUF1538 domain-containing protein [Clostridia bacterium]|nr:DUF1538 domain-containing protein [Clostridia bacterium]
MISILFSKIKESLLSVLPITLIVVILSFTPAINLTVTEILIFTISAIVLILGIGMFNMGADIAMTPMGEQVGSGLTKSKKLWLLILVCFFMGVLITVAEPDLTVLANQVEKVMDSTVLIVTVGVGVGLFLVVSILKIVFKKNLSTLLMFFYMVLFMLSAILIESGKASFLPMAFDSGGVTTGPITVPFIMALGVGVASTIGGKNASENSFGLIALCSIGPVLAIVVLSLLANNNLNYDVYNYAIPANGGEIFHIIGVKAKEVLIALGLIVLFFTALQIFVLKLPKQRIKKIVVGIVYTFIGLVLFLSSVEVGFMPIGNKIGQQIAGSNAIVILFAFLLGFVVVMAEPAVHVLNKQVEEITGGTVTKTSMMLALSIGVGVSVCLSVIRIIFDFSILWYLVPGYCISLGLSFFVPKMYTAIAFDSGGVASGPLTSTFILPFVVGVCTSIYPDPNQVLNLAFGMVAMVAMTPLITIQVLGFRAVVSEKVREKLVLKRILADDDEQIINFM